MEINFYITLAFIKVTCYVHKKYESFISDILNVYFCRERFVIFSDDREEAMTPMQKTVTHVLIAFASLVAIATIIEGFIFSSFNFYSCLW